MRSVFVTIFCTLLAASSALPLRAQATQSAQAPPPQAAPRDPILLPETTQKISPNIYVIPDKDTTPGVPNVGIIIGARGVLVVDTGMGDRNGKIALDEAEKLAPNHALYLVTTHVHPEHDLGANAFPPSTTMIRSTAQVQEIAETGMTMANTFSAHSAVNADLLKGASFRKADVTFDKEYTLDLGGGVQARLVAEGPDHTLGDTVIFVTPDQVLFAGDLAMKGMPAFTSPHSSLNHWLTTLDHLDALNPAIVVPSHGPLGDKAFIDGYRRYLTVVRNRTAELKKTGQTVDQITATLTTELARTYPTQRLAGAIQSAYKEAP